MDETHSKTAEIAVVLMVMLCVVSIHLSGLILIVTYELQFELRLLFIFAGRICDLISVDTYMCKIDPSGVCLIYTGM